jgi:hypothetical protein
VEEGVSSQLRHCDDRHANFATFAVPIRYSHRRLRDSCGNRRDFLASLKISGDVVAMAI